MEKQRIILVGRAASGKDYLRKMLEDNDFQYQVSYTTRPARKGEVEGKDYNFLTTNQFHRAIHAKFWYEYVEFNNWFYGTSVEQFCTPGSVFIMTPVGLGHVSEKERADRHVIFLDMPEDIRRARISLRNDADSVERRILADNKDFEDFTNYDVRITDPEFKYEDINIPQINMKQTV